MLTVNGRAARGFHVVLTALAVTALAVRISATRAAIPKSFGRFRQRDIESRSEDIVRELDPQLTTVVLCTSTGQTYGPGRPVHRYWTVDVSTPSGDSVAYLLWNADTGDLISLTRSTHYLELSVDVLLSKDRSTVQALGWLQRLKVSDDSQDWIPDSAELGTTVWHNSFHSASRTADVVIDPYTGDLVSLRERVRATNGY